MVTDRKEYKLESFEHTLILYLLPIASSFAQEG